MRLVCGMIVGPGEADRHLEGCLLAAQQWSDELFVYGDAPDPASRDLIERYADHYRIGDTNLYEQGEHLVRNQLWEMLDEHLEVGDILCLLDADESFAEPPAIVRERLAALEHDSRESFSVRFFHLWTEDGTMHRVDGAWNSPVGPRICRFRKGYRLQPLYETAWVCPPLPPHLLHNTGSPVLHMLHWSYAREHDRAPKHKRYTEKLGHDLRHVNSIIETPTLEMVPCFS